MYILLMRMLAMIDLEDVKKVLSSICSAQELIKQKIVDMMLFNL